MMSVFLYARQFCLLLCLALICSACSSAGKKRNTPKKYQTIKSKANEAEDKLEKAVAKLEIYFLSLENRYQKRREGKKCNFGEHKKESKIAFDTLLNADEETQSAWFYMLTKKTASEKKYVRSNRWARRAFEHGVYWALYYPDDNLRFRKLLRSKDWFLFLYCDQLLKEGVPVPDYLKNAMKVAGIWELFSGEKKKSNSLLHLKPNVLREVDIKCKM